MQNYAPGTPVMVRFALHDAAGAVLTPTALRTRILDEAETVLQNWTNLTLPTPGGDSVEASVIGALNLLTPPATRGIRTVELEVTTAGGTVMLSESYMLQTGTSLAFGTNSFLTYAQALLLAETFVLPASLAGWSSVSRTEREAALTESHERLLRLPLEIHFDDNQAIDGAFTASWGPNRLEYLNPAQLATLYPPMLAALKKAQLVEADEILRDDPVKRARREGLISNTTGESSQFFRTSKPLDLPVSPRALAYLERWVRFGAVIGRR